MTKKKASKENKIVKTETTYQEAIKRAGPKPSGDAGRDLL